jgi:hypothetical protein
MGVLLVSGAYRATDHTSRRPSGLYIDMRKAPRGGPPAGGKISMFPDPFYLSRPLGD